MLYNINTHVVYQNGFFLAFVVNNTVISDLCGFSATLFSLAVISLHYSGKHYTPRYESVSLQYATIHEVHLLHCNTCNPNHVRRIGECALTKSLSANKEKYDTLPFLVHLHQCAYCLSLGLQSFDSFSLTRERIKESDEYRNPNNLENCYNFVNLSLIETKTT